MDMEKASERAAEAAQPGIHHFAAAAVPEDIPQRAPVARREILQLSLEKMWQLADESGRDFEMKNGTIDPLLANRRSAGYRG